MTAYQASARGGVVRVRVAGDRVKLGGHAVTVLKGELLNTATAGGIQIRDTRDISKEAVLDLYRSVNWSSAKKPNELHQALVNSHSLMTAWDGDRLIGLANAISDGFLVVYYPHFVVHPDYQRNGIGKEMMTRLMQRYRGFHQHSVIADGEAVAFYEKCGFERSVCTAMWIYDGNDH
jgi:GNAT superfamily N-acetyltransferase